MDALSGTARAFLVRPLRQPVPPRIPPRPYRVAPWNAERLEELAAVHCAAYADTVERVLFQSTLGSPGACGRYLRALTGQPGLFRFSAAASALLVRDTAVCGGILVTTGPEGTACVETLGVAPGHRGGTGEALLRHALARLRGLGCTSVGLHVTRANARAARLYARCGFVECAALP